MVKQLDQSRSMAYATGVLKAADAQPKLQGLVFQTNIDNRCVTFRTLLRSQIIFGRNDEQTGVDIDLTVLGALAKGVSRKHLLLVYQKSRLLVQDLGSTNGTRLNGKLLQPGNFNELKDYDELRLGKLKLRVTFAYEPITATQLVDQSQATDRNSSQAMCETVHDVNSRIKTPR